MHSGLTTMTSKTRTEGRALGYLGLCLCLGAILQVTGSMRAAILTVTTTNDYGLGSLRQMIQEAAPNDTVNFNVTGTITLTNGELLITNDLTIKGPGRGNLSISGNGQSRVFQIASNGVTRISGV